MNEEKEDICYGGFKGYGKTYCEMIRLQQQNKELHNKIDKAIEYIKTSSLEVNTKDYGMLTVCNSDDLSEILKDSDVDEK